MQLLFSNYSISLELARKGLVLWSISIKEMIHQISMIIFSNNELNDNNTSLYINLFTFVIFVILFDLFSYHFVNN